MKYQLEKTALQTFILKVSLDNGVTSWIPISPDNTDYANFKREINEGTAQLQNADGNLMTAEQAKDFVKELP